MRERGSGAVIVGGQQESGAHSGKAEVEKPAREQESQTERALTGQGMSFLSSSVAAR